MSGDAGAATPANLAFTQHALGSRPAHLVQQVLQDSLLTLKVLPVVQGIGPMDLDLLLAEHLFQNAHQERALVLGEK